MDILSFTSIMVYNVCRILDCDPMDLINVTNVDLAFSNACL